MPYSKCPACAQGLDHTVGYRGERCDRLKSYLRGKVWTGTCRCPRCSRMPSYTPGYVQEPDVTPMLAPPPLQNTECAPALKGPDEIVPMFRTLGALMPRYRLTMRSPLYQS